MSFWDVILDFGLMSGLILLGQLLRAKMKVFQELFIPASLLAGIIGLICGPYGLGIIPFSQEFSAYSGALIVLVFAALPLSQEKSEGNKRGSGVMQMWGFQLLTYLGQHLWAMVLGLVVFIPFFQTHEGFGYMLPTGFVGGHGTAAAVGETFRSLGWEEAEALGMTSATVGILSGLIGGIILIKIATKKGYTNYITDFVKLPQSFRTGLIPEEEREEMGKETFSTISVDPLAIHVALLFVVAYVAKKISELVLHFNSQLSLPVFSLAVLVGFLLMKILHLGGADKYVDKRVVTRLSSTFTDYLVGFGVASIQLGVVVKYAVPLILLFTAGLLFNLFICLYLAPRVFSRDWFEKGIFTYGWASGVTAIGITVLRICDPNFDSSTLDDFSISYLFGNMWAELIIVSVGPVMIASGMSLPYTGALAAALLVVVVITVRMKKMEKQREKA